MGSGSAPGPLAVLGNGGFGTALSLVFARLGLAVRMWGHDGGYTEQLARTRENPRYLPGFRLPQEVLVAGDPRPVVEGAAVVLCAIPTQHLRSALPVFRPLLAPDVPVVSLAKGLEESTSLRPTEVVSAVLGPRPLAVLSGPSHAEEVAAGLPASLVLASHDPALAERLQMALTGPELRIYRGTDPLGVELCGALKNIVALAAGIADGLGLGDNAKAALLARGLAEMVRFGAALGAARETFFGLAGVGDLCTTAFSPHGRNRAMGERIGRGETLADALASTRKVAEGVLTSRATLAKARALGIEMPITEQVVEVLFQGKPPRDAVRDLMARYPREESPLPPAL